MNQQPLESQPIETNNSSKKTWIPIALLGLLTLIVLGGSLVALLLPKKPSPQATPPATTNRPGSFADITNLSLQPSTSSPQETVTQFLNLVPEETVTQFLNLVKENKTDQAKLLISDKANQGVDFITPLSGKQFTFSVTNVNTEIQGTVSRVAVNISQQNRPSFHTYVLLNTTGEWLLVDQQISQIVSEKEDQEAPQ